MSAESIVGALRGVLVLDTGDWTPAISRARGDLSSLRSAFESLHAAVDNVAKTTQRIGVSITAGITVPLAALGATANKTASGFEASMKRVEAALDGVTGSQLKALSDQARSLGPAVGKGATEAADGIEALGLAGLATSDILGGGLKSALDLAAAGAAPVAEAASLVTDVMGQFKVQADELPTAVRNVVGALDASKFGFSDFQQAVAAGGGVAASAGVAFSDFATAIAATSTQFSSGSDAGTSFKTYIQSLVPISAEAERAMQKLGINFFDLQTGRMKPLAEQAEILRTALSGLNDRSKTDALKVMFGSDAARTAIGLMEQGRQGIVDLQNTIASGDVGGKIAKRMEGEAAATTRMANAFESLKISIGQAGLTAAMTAIKNAFASVLESMANASPAVHKVGVALGLLASAAGPLVLVLGTVARVLIAKFAAGFGMIGRIIGLIVSPVTTIIGLLGEVGLRGALTMLGRSLLGITGPIGLAITAFLVFKDYIIDALALVWAEISTTLGPPLSAIMDKCEAIFAKLSGGAIGGAFATLMGWLAGLRDFIGTGLAAGIVVAGEIIERTLGVIVAVIGGLVDVVAGVVDAVSALLSGDFAGAWQATGDIIESVCGTIVDIIAAIVPEIGMELQLVYAAAKAWLGDGFSAIAGLFTGTVQAAVDYVASAFPTVVAAAKGVYDGVKGWLVDKFGVLMTWIGNAAKWIGDKYAALKDRLGLGGVGQDDTPAAPVAPRAGAAPRAPQVPGTRNVSFEAPKKERKAREKKGRDTTHDAENREQLALQIELDAARARGDKEAEQRLQDRLALSRQIEAYQRTGLTIDQARVAANRDMATIAAARAEAAARELADEQVATNLDAARLGHNQALIESLERQVELKRRIAFYYEQTKNLAEATRLAEADQAKMDAARAAVRTEWFENDRREREVDLARARGDSDERIRLLEREIEVRRRARELEDQGVDATGAITQAASEWDEEEKARLTGVFRTTFKDGVRAALDGDVKDFFKNWWKDRMAKGMEEALNSLADTIQTLLGKIGSGGQGGGISGVLGSVLGMFRGGRDMSSSVAGVLKGAPTDFGNGVLGPMDFPGFRTGGSFTVGGMSGVDANLVAFRATKGEMVDIRRPGNDFGRQSRPSIVQLMVGEGQMFEPRVQSISGDVSVQTTRASNGRADMRARQSLVR